MDVPKINKFFLYARKSTESEDRQVLSIEAQLTEVRAYAKREGITIVKEFIEKKSAKKPGRPVFNKLLDKIDKGEAKGIVSWHPDRLARNSVDGGRIIYLLDRGKIKSLKFPQFWFEPTPQGKFMLNIAFGQSKYFSDSLSENTKRGLRQKVRRGEYPKKAPFGYYNDTQTKTIKIDKQVAPFVRKMFKLYSKGNWSYEALSDFLTNSKICDDNGKRIYKTRIVRLLTNPVYYGHFYYKGELHKGTHEPIITKKLFDRVQEVLKQRSKPMRKNSNPKPFTGLLRCGECGMMITAELQKGHVYYRCTKKNKTIDCKQPYAREENLDRQLSSLIQKVSLRTDWADKMLSRLEKEELGTAQSVRSFVQKRKEEIEAIDNKQRFLLDSYLDKVIDRATYLEKKNELTSQKKTLREKISSLEQNGNCWLEPMREWIKKAAKAAKIARGKDLFAKKALASEIFGSNLRLENKKARGCALAPYKFF
jgi:DNA invertase Pin-like site-specific DNA recombinase